MINKKMVLHVVFFIGILGIGTLAIGYQRQDQSDAMRTAVRISSEFSEIKFPRERS